MDFFASAAIYLMLTYYKTQTFAILIFDFFLSIILLVNKAIFLSAICCIFQTYFNKMLS